MFRAALATAALLAAVGVLWSAGEMHRENCIRQDRGFCSVLPWDNGHDAKVSEAEPTPTTVAAPLTPAERAAARREAFLERRATRLARGG